jgi:endonuclease G
MTRRTRSGVGKKAGLLGAAAAAIAAAVLIYKGPKTETLARETDLSTPVAAFAEVGGLPREAPPRAGYEEFVNTGYAVGYDEALLAPLWSAYYCPPDVRFKSSERSPFAPDLRLPEAFRLVTKDFNNTPGATKYDRGHMAPNSAIATRYGEKAQKETFLLTNIVPQRSELNQTFWRYLEKKISDVWAPQMKGVWVVVGPVFGKNPRRMNGRAAIADAFYCIVLDRDEATGNLRALALLVPQQEKGNLPLAPFETSIREIERRTGLDFFSALPDTVEVPLEERAKADAFWNAAANVN